MNAKINKLIFGIKIGFKLIKKEHHKIITEEFNGYDDVSDAEIIVQEVESFEGVVLSRNPSFHLEYEDGFLIKDRIIDIRFLFDDKKLSKVEFKLNESKGVKTFLRKLYNNQFTNRSERFGQILHEQILVPICFFRDDLLPIHCSGITNNKEAFLFGGTGGVGKTSIEIILGSKENVGFITDDIAIVDSSNHIHKNLNYPKIYAYNAVGNSKLESSLIHSKFSLDQLHWTLTKSLRGNSMVRRRVDPEEMYGKIEINSVPVAQFYFLVKENVPKLKVKTIDARKAAKLSLDIIKTEYFNYIKSILWHQYNCELLGKEAFINVEDLSRKWLMLGEHLFENCEVNKISIPIVIEHKDFLSDIEHLFQDKLK